MRFTTAFKIAVISAGSAALLGACGKGGEAGAQSPAATASAIPEGWADVEASFVDADGDEVGEIGFKQTPGGGVLMRVSVYGLSQGWHGIHLHQTGDCSDGADGFKKSGGHIDPQERAHGLLNPDGPEAADMPNIYAQRSGMAIASFLNERISLDDPALADADGFAVVVHENADDHMTQPIGGAGGRVACAAVRLGG